MALEVVNIGFGNVVIADRVVAVVRADSAPSRRMIEAAGHSDRLVDATSGRRTRSLIVTDSNHVLLSHMQPGTIRDKLTGKHGGVEEEGDDAQGR